MPYQHLNVTEREKIQEGLRSKKSPRSIAENIGRSVSTISRELARNETAERQIYTPTYVEERAKEKRKERGRHDRLKNKTIREYAIAKLKDGYSPEQIVGRLPIEVFNEGVALQNRIQVVVFGDLISMCQNIPHIWVSFLCDGIDGGIVSF